MIAPATKREIDELLARGESFGAIARRMNAQGVPAPAGGPTWYAMTVKRHADPEYNARYMRQYRAGIRVRG